MGFCARDVGGTADGHFAGWGFRVPGGSTGWWLHYKYYSSSTTTEGVPTIDGRQFWPQRFFWVRQELAGTYKRFYHSADGVNWIKNSLTLTWETLTLDQAVVIDTFFSDQGGDVPFYYTVSDDLAPTKWTCEDWSVKRGQGCLRTINATLTQNFSTLT